MIVPALLLLAGCEICHPQIARSWVETGMARSFSRVESVPLLDAFYHQPSDRYYRIVRKEGKFYLRRRQIGYRGAETNVMERSIDYAVGSGSHARSYVHSAAGGRLIELPLSWYAEDGGRWAMSPGFDRPDHLDFRRPVSEECLFCHTGSGAGAAIGCERCHGPGSAHQKAPSPANIVNPARLSPDRQMEVCMQCHLQTTSRFLPHALRRYDRPTFSYRPGEPLAAYMLHFDHAAGTGYGEKFEVNSSAYRLRQSRCYFQSRGRLTCTTCHNPHHTAEPPSHYTQACRSCHAASHNPDSAGCVDCHMPKRRSEDAVHVVTTDHRIQRRPPQDLRKPLAESKTVYQGPVALYYPASPESPDDALYLAVAQVVEAGNLQNGIRRLEELIAQLRPERAEFYFELAEAYRKSGRYAEAAGFYQQATRRGPSLGKAYDRLGDVLLRSGDLSRAGAALDHALKINPNDPEALDTLGVVSGQQGKIDASIRLLKKAVEVNPDLPLAWLNLGVSLEQKGQPDAAEAAYREAIRVQPDFARARGHLANLLEARGDLDQARYERAIETTRKR